MADCQNLDSHKCSDARFKHHCCATCRTRSTPPPKVYNKPPCSGKGNEEVTLSYGSISAPRCSGSSATCPKVQFGHGSSAVRFATSATCSFRNPATSSAVCVISCDLSAHAGQCPEASVCKSVPPRLAGICVY